MKRNKVLKVRIYPNETQRTQINKTLGCARALYNMMLHERITFYEENKEDKRKVYEHKYKEASAYKKEYEWLKEADSQALAWAKVNLSNAYSNFFKSLKGTRKGQKVGFPKYKKKKLGSSYTSSNTNNNMEVDFENKKVKLPKCGWINYRDQRTSFDGKLKSVTVSRTSTGKYFASFLYEQEVDEVTKKKVTDPEKVLGLDLSLENFYIDQNGNSPEFQRNTRKYEKQLAVAQRRMSKKKKGSKNWEKAKLRVAKVHEKITNSREDFARKLATDLSENYDAVCIETLSLKGMSRALKLGKSVHDLGYATFIQRLEQKSEETGCHIIKADQFFASSKTCSTCGYKYKDLALHERKWTCPKCGVEHHRDINAGKNLHRVGLEILGLG